MHYSVGNAGKRNIIRVRSQGIGIGTGGDTASQRGSASNGEDTGGKKGKSVKKARQFLFCIFCYLLINASDAVFMQ
jgi:hypothetical protein